MSKIYYCYDQANIGPIVSRFEFRNAHRLYHVFFNVFHEKCHFWIFDFDHDLSCFFKKTKKFQHFNQNPRIWHPDFFKKKEEIPTVLTGKTILEQINLQLDKFY